MTVSNHLTKFNSEYITPSIKWVNKNKLVVASIALSILIGIACYRSPGSLDLMKKGVKLLTIVVPVAYTLPAPFVIAGIVACQGPDRALGAYYFQSVAKVWQMWFVFVGL